MSFPQRKAAIVGVYNTKQAKMLEGTPWTCSLGKGGKAKAQ